MRSHRYRQRTYSKTLYPCVILITPAIDCVSIASMSISINASGTSYNEFMAISCRNNFKSDILEYYTYHMTKALRLSDNPTEIHYHTLVLIVLKNHYT